MNFFNYLSRVSIFCLLISSFTACSERIAFGGCPYRLQTGECQTEIVKKIKDVDITASSYAAADALLEAGIGQLLEYKSIAAAGVANLNQLEKTSALGRLIGEQVAARFVQRGYAVVDIKFQESLLAPAGDGEFTPPKELHNLYQQQPRIQAVCFGTYTTGANAVYVNLRLVRLQDSAILSSFNFTLPLGPNTYTLLHDE